jgi:hypothetical protein
MTLGNASLPDHVDAEIPSPHIHSLGSKGQNVWERPPETTKTTRRPKKTIMALDFLSFFRREEVQLITAPVAILLWGFAVRFNDFGMFHCAVGRVN